MQLLNIFTIIFLSFFFLSIIVKITLDIINYNHRKKYQDTIPPELNGLIDKKKLSLINKYSNVKLAFSLIEYFFDKSLLLVILFLGLIPFYYNFLAERFTNIYFLGLLFFAGFYLIQMIIGIPFSLYFNFIIEKKFQFNKMTLKIWIGDFIKKIIISVILGTIILVALMFFLYTFKNIWWLLLWLFFFLFSLIMQVIYPTVIAPLFNKFKPLSNEELKNKIEELFKHSGLKPDGIFEMDASKRSTHSNAYFTGLGKAKRIVLFDSLLQKHTDDEILAIFAHEIGHYKHKHVLKNLILSTVFSLISLFLAYLLINNPGLYRAFGFSQNLDIEKVKLVGLLFLSIIGAPIGFFFTPFSSMFSRRHEYQADKYSTKIMKTPEPLIEALKKLNIDNLSNIYPSDIYAWFYYSHPPLFKRIRTLKSFSL